MKHSIEHLEARRLLALTTGGGSTALVGGTIVVRGTGGDDLITIAADKTTLHVGINGQSWSWPATAVRELDVDGLAGADLIENRTAIDSTIRGGDGADTLAGGDGIDWLHGDAGDDVLKYSAGLNYLSGGPGTDQVDSSGALNGVAMDGSPEIWPTPLPFGNVALIYDEVPAAPSVLNTYVDSVTTEAFRLSRFDDFVAFAVFNFTFDFVVTIYGGEGNDVFRPGSERVVAYGEEGNDIFFAHPEVGEQMTCYGGAGGDSFQLDPDMSVIADGDGDDTLIPGPGTVGETIDLRRPGMPGHVMHVRSSAYGVTTVIGDERPNLITTDSPDLPGYEITTFPVSFVGNGGDDTLVGGLGDDTLDGGAGADLICGRPDHLEPPVAVPSDADLILGGDGSDTLRGGPGADHLVGGDGDDWLIADADGEPDTLDGGGGFDRVLTLSSDGNDVLLNVERIMPARLSRLAVDVLFPDLFPPASRSASEAIGSANGRLGPDGPVLR